MYFNFMDPSRVKLIEKFGAYEAIANNIAKTEADAPIAIEVFFYVFKYRNILKAAIYTADPIIPPIRYVDSNCF